MNGLTIMHDRRGAGNGSDDDGDRFGGLYVVVRLHGALLSPVPQVLDTHPAEPVLTGQADTGLTPGANPQAPA